MKHRQFQYQPARRFKRFENTAKLVLDKKILIIGVPGYVGSFAVQIAIRLGVEVWSVYCDSKKSYVRTLGAHQVIDYESESITDAFDCIIDASNFLSIKQLRRLLKSGRRLVIVGAAADHGSSGFSRLFTTTLLSLFFRSRSSALFNLKIKMSCPYCFKIWRGSELIL